MGGSAPDYNKTNEVEWLRRHILLDAGVLEPENEGDQQFLVNLRARQIAAGQEMSPATEAAISRPGWPDLSTSFLPPEKPMETGIEEDFSNLLEEGGDTSDQQP